MSKLDELLRELCPDGVEYKKLGEIATISRGGNFQKKDFLTEGVPCIHYGQIYTKYGLFTDKTFTFISEECAKKQKMAQPNDIVMAVTSENIEDVCKCLAWLGDEPVAVSGHSAIIHHNQNAKYLVYYFHSQMFFSQKRKLAHGTKVIEVTPDTLVNIAKLSGTMDKLQRLTPEGHEIADEEVAAEIQEEAKERKAPFSFIKCGIPMGAEVVLQNHPEVVAVVKDDRQIEYQGKAYSLSALAQKIMQTTYPLQGPVHWLYQGRKLRDIRVEREEAGLYE